MKRRSRVHAQSGRSARPTSHVVATRRSLVVSPQMSARQRGFSEPPSRATARRLRAEPARPDPRRDQDLRRCESTWRQSSRIRYARPRRQPFSFLLAPPRRSWFSLRPDDRYRALHASLPLSGCTRCPDRSPTSRSRGVPRACFRARAGSASPIPRLRLWSTSE